jgi:hypothetical protein
MEKVSGKAGRENQNSRFTLTTFFPKIIPLLENYSTTAQLGRP